MRSIARFRLLPILLLTTIGFFASTLILLFFTATDDNVSAGGFPAPNRIHSALKKQARRLASAVNATASALTCRDLDSGCPGWAALDECRKNPIYMNHSCPRSCGLCPSLLGSTPQDLRAAGRRASCEDKSSFCGQWAAVGECDSNPLYMRTNCPVTCHLCQSSRCHDQNESRCKDEARAGLCRTDPDRMFKECRWSCKWCAMETSSRCRRAPGVSPAASRGTLDYMFQRAANAEHLSQYSPVVHSRSPWVVSFETFLSAEEAERIIQVGGKGWQRSMAGDGVQAVRTSSTAWCDYHSCQRDPVLARVRARIANLTLVPERNAEHLQVLKYDTGQFYKTHHDQNSPLTSAWGPRMYTFFMYLNDGEGGGETHFPRLNISVKPKRGRALLWPSVLDHDPRERDDRTEHEAVTVSKGVKFAANYWLHMYDFQYANERGCGNNEVFGNWVQM